MDADVREAVREIAIRWMDTPEGQSFLYDMMQDAYNEGYENGLVNQENEDVISGED